MIAIEDQARSIFLAALERAPDQWPAYLNEACADSADLRARVNELLDAHREMGTIQGGRGNAIAIQQPPIAEGPGAVIGPYKLLQQIGEGGMGVVFMAEQSEPIQRTVALKIIKPGMDTRQVIARFEAERQALAMMDHPNIAKVLDAGTTESGRPFFVMELVKGVLITKYCDQKNLSLHERLKLLLSVCAGVQHAHQKGIIHRDLKPTNVMVAEYDNHAVPKIIDFGVAKATAHRLTESTMFTEYGQLIGTFEYMSPEQAKLNQLDVDTRSDIYSLGVLLYELLTDSTPFEKQRLETAAFDETLRVIREEEPPAPSTRLQSSQTLPAIAAHRRVEPERLSQLVRGDLDWIVMKALEKDRSRRYETASDLAQDIERHLNDEPVQASPPSATYRLRKFVRRHKLGVVASVAVATAVLLGVAGTTGGMVWALREQKAAQANAARATTQAERSDQVAHFLEDMLEGVAPSVAQGRDTTMLREIVDKTALRIDNELEGQPEVQAELRLMLAQLYFELQLYREVEKIARHTLKMARADIGEENAWVADALMQCGRALNFLRAFDEAESMTRQAIAMERRLRGEGPKEATALCSLSDTLRHQAEIRGDRVAQLAEAEQVARESLAIRRKHLGNDHDNTAWSLIVLSLALQSQHKYPEFESAVREAYGIRMRLHGEMHPFTAIDLQYLGLALALQGKLDEAETSVRLSLEISEKMEAKATISRAEAHWILGDILRKQNKLDEAETYCRTAVAIAKREMGADYLDLPMFLSALADVLSKQDKLPESRQCAQEAVDICRRHPDQVERWQQEKAAAALENVVMKLGSDSAKVKD